MATAEKLKQREAHEQINERKHLLYEKAVRPTAAGRPRKSFEEYLRETPPAPLSQGARNMLWGAGAVVVALFGLTLAVAATSKARHKVPARPYVASDLVPPAASATAAAQPGAAAQDRPGGPPAPTSTAKPAEDSKDEPKPGAPNRPDGAPKDGDTKTGGAPPTGPPTPPNPGGSAGATGYPGAGGGGPPGGPTPSATTNPGGSAGAPGYPGAGGGGPPPSATTSPGGSAGAPGYPGVPTPSATTRPGGSAGAPGYPGVPTPSATNPNARPAPGGGPGHPNIPPSRSQPNRAKRGR